MGCGDEHHLNFHIHLPDLHHHHDHMKKELKNIPKGYLAILVGQGEEQQRFVIPVIYINHPPFVKLLKEVEEEFGFDQKGPLTNPCQMEEFRKVQRMIDKETANGPHYHHHHLLCFSV